AFSLRVRYDPDWRLPPALLGEVLFGRDALHFVRRRGGFHLSLGHHSPRSEALRTMGDAGLYRHLSGRLLLYMEERRSRLGRRLHEAGGLLMTLSPAITDL